MEVVSRQGRGKEAMELNETSYERGGKGGISARISS